MPPNAPQARVLTKDFSAVPIAERIAKDAESTATKLGSSFGLDEKFTQPASDHDRTDLPLG